MNETTRPDGASGVSWPTRDQRVSLSDPLLLPAGDKPPSAAVGLLHQAVQGAHETLDRLAAGAAPAVQQLGDSALAAGVALHAKTDALRETRDAWVASTRTTIRGNPLACVAGAWVLGMVIARLSR